MNKLLIWVGLILIGLMSCEDKNESKLDLLIGNWKQRTNISAEYTPTVTFYANGEYKICDLINLYSANTLYQEVTVTGKFNFKNNEIEFITASVEYKNDSIDITIENNDNTDIYFAEGISISDFFSHWNTDSINNINTGKTFIKFNYSPLIWNVISLTENQLKITVMPSDTVSYIR